MKVVADKIVKARSAYILGVGACHSLAHSFWYVTRMALDNLVHVPRQGNLPIDDIAHIGRKDLLLAMTFNPYRAEVVDAVRLAKKRGATVVAISDSRSSPIVLASDHAFIVPNATPQFFPSSLTALVMLETLTAFVVADADRRVVANIENFHRAREAAGIYWQGEAT